MQSCGEEECSLLVPGEMGVGVNAVTHRLLPAVTQATENETGSFANAGLAATPEEETQESGWGKLTSVYDCEGRAGGVHCSFRLKP